MRETQATKVAMTWPATLRTDPKSWVATVRAAIKLKGNGPVPGPDPKGLVQTTCLMHSTDSNSVTNMV